MTVDQLIAELQKVSGLGFGDRAVKYFEPSGAHDEFYRIVGVDSEYAKCLQHHNAVVLL